MESKKERKKMKEGRGRFDQGLGGRKRKGKIDCNEINVKEEGKTEE